MHYQKTSVALAIFSVLSSAHAANSDQLNNVIVTANNTPQSLESVTSNVTVITAEDIENHQYQTLQDALRQVPGLSSYSNGGPGTSMSVYMRGMNTTNLVVLKDGISLYDPKYGYPASFENITLDDVERIEIIKGPQSGVWGANASAGVINIITKKGGKRANVNFEVGSNNRKKLAANLGAGNDKVDFAINFSDLSTDGFTALKQYKTSGADDEKDDYQNQTVNFKLGVNPTKNQRIEAFVQQLSSAGNYDASQNPNDSTSTTSYDNQLRQLKYIATLGRVQTKLFAQDTHITTAYSESKVNEFGGQADWHYADNQQASLALGSKQFFDITGKNSFYNRSAALNNTNQFIDQKWVITEAVRYDEYNKFENKTTGKVGTKYHFTPRVFISGNYGTGYNAPSAYQLTNIVPGVSELKPESTTGYDATLGAFGLELTFFHNDVADELTYDSNTYKYYNQKGTSKYEGIEATYKRNIDAINSDLTLNFTQQTAKDKDGKWLARRPEQQGGFTFDYYGISKTHIGVQTKYVGTEYDKADKGGANIGNYSVTDLVADYQVNKHLSVYGKVQNLFNEDYTTAADSHYEADGVTPKYVYNNGGTLWFVGVRGKL